MKNDPEFYLVLVCAKDVARRQTDDGTTVCWLSEERVSEKHAHLVRMFGTEEEANSYCDTLTPMIWELNAQNSGIYYLTLIETY